MRIITVLLAVVAGFALGVVVVSGLLRHTPAANPADGEPKTPPPAETSASVTVVTSSPGMPAEEVAQGITRRVERWVSQAPGVTRTESRSVTGLSVVRLWLARPGDAALAQVASLATAALPSLPPGTLPPVVLPGDPAGTSPAGALVLGAPALSLAELTDLARDHVRPRLISLPGLVAPGVLGGTERAVRIDLDPARLQAYNLSPLDVLAALEKVGERVPSGTVVVGNQQYQLRGGQPAADLRDLGHLLLRKDGNLFLRDVGRIAEAADPVTLVRVDGRRQVCVPVYAREGATGGAIEKALPRLQEKLPEGVRLSYLPYDAGLITVLVRGPSGTRLSAMEKSMAEVERAIQELIAARERTFLSTEVGRSSDLFGAYSTSSGPQDATLCLRLTPEAAAAAPEHVRRLRRLFLERFPQLQAACFLGREVKFPLVVQIEGGSLEQGQRLVQAVRERVAGVKGAVDVQLGERLDQPTLVVEVDRHKAALVGVTSADVLRQVAAATGNGPRVTLDVRGASIAVLVSSDGQGAERSLEDLTNLPIAIPKAPQPVHLRDVAALRRVSAPVEIHHVNLARVFTVRANVEGRDRAAVAADIEEVLKGLEMPKGLRVEVQGR
jgi:multidrug efflux pump subunit AcrB